MVVFSVERLIAVYFPIKNHLIYSSNRKKFSVCFVIVFSLAIYSFNLVTTGSEPSLHSINECVPLEDWLILTKYMTLADTAITMLIPFVSISIINTAIGIRLARGSKYNLFTLFSMATTSTTNNASSTHNTTITHQTKLHKSSTPSVKFYNSTHDSINQQQPLHNNNTAACGEQSISYVNTRYSPVDLGNANREGYCVLEALKVLFTIIKRVFLHLF